MNVKEDYKTFSLACKNIGEKKPVTRVIYKFYGSMTENDFNSFTSSIVKLLGLAEQSKQNYCVVFDIQDTAFFGPFQIARFILLLRQNREIIKQYSLTTAIVTSDGISEFINKIFKIYTPVGHVEVTTILKQAKQHCKECALRNEQ